MLEAGLLVCVNSDDPAYFGGYVDDNFRALAAETALGRADLAQLAENAFTAAWLEPDRREELVGQVREWLAG